MEYVLKYVFIYVMLSIAVGLFASIYRQRKVRVWFIISMVVTPLVGFVFALIIKPREGAG